MEQTSKTAVILNLLVFKAAWAAVVLSAAAGTPIYGLIAVAIAVAIHLWRSNSAETEIRLLLVAGVVGLVWETFLVRAGLIGYTTGHWLPGAAPYWIVAMWILFATTLNVGMRWLRSSRAIAALAGAIGGPLAFVTGASLGATELLQPVTTHLYIAIGWAVFLPLLVHLARRLDSADRLVSRAA